MSSTPVIENPVSIDVWLKFLETNPPKAQDQFAEYENEAARCCLGHYCYLSVGEVSSDQAMFADPVGGWHLPSDHWLLKPITEDEYFTYLEEVWNQTDPDGLGETTNGMRMGVRFTLEDLLAVLNDNVDGYTEYTEVINAIKWFKARWNLW